MFTTLTPFLESENSRGAFSIRLTAPLPNALTLNLSTSATQSQATLDMPSVTFQAGSTGQATVLMTPAHNTTRDGDIVVAVRVFYGGGEACFSQFDQSVDVTIRDDERYTFVTDATAGGSYANGTPNAQDAWDAFCVTQSAGRLGGVYKAVIGTATRRSLASGGPLDWPLRPQHNYLLARSNNTAGPTAFVTDANALPSFSPPLALLDTGQMVADIWLGLQSSWANAFENCGNWANSGDTGVTANPAASTQGTFFGAAVPCNGQAHIWCVEE